MRLLEFRFKGEMIRGMLQGNSKRLIIMSHGFTGNRIDHHAFATKVANLMEASGFSVLRFDYLGNGESSGSEEMYRAACEIEQLQFILDEMKQKYEDIILYGFSYGGVISSHVAARNDDQVSNLILVNPAGNMNEIIEQFIGESIKVDGGYDFIGYHFSDGLVEDIKAFNTWEGIERFTNPVYMIESMSDEYVSRASFQTYKDIYGKLMHAYPLVDCDHCFRGLDQTSAMLEVIQEVMEELR